MHRLVSNVGASRFASPPPPLAVVAAAAKVAQQRVACKYASISIFLKTTHGHLIRKTNKNYKQTKKNVSLWNSVTLIQVY